MKFLIALFTVITLVFPVMYGCKEEMKTRPVKKEAPKLERIEVQPAVQVQETPEKESGGYIYDPGDRRDPFMPLILPVEILRKGGKRITGTLESYDISDFTLVAIAKKESKYYALITAPDNKAYTVREGTIIGLRKGKVTKITSNIITMIEYSKDYLGKMKSRQIFLELHKGEVE